ncbi:hypothetical protein CCR75_008869 [Bremia lactucae]|uniref:Uncharacterized protein n=1 Tax=Bremia lactucae TaxID=4779 RepID=A0A976FF08_BRELC|nr:hypothetical protein CCR75_008869 [Bremia lactucae]
MVLKRLRRNGARIRKALEVCNLEEHARRLVRCSPPHRVLGLDINTNSTGFAIVTERGRVCRWGHIPTDHFASADVMQIGEAIDNFLATVHTAELQKEPVQWTIGIEAFMRMFLSGRFNNAGIFQLAQLNGIVSYACWKRFGVLPLHTHPSAARSFFGLRKRMKKSKNDSIKNVVMTFLEQQEPELTLAAGRGSDTTALPTFQRLRTGALADSAFDIADAYVIAAYTRCVHFKTQLEALQPHIAETFSRRYLEMTFKAAAKAKKSSIEMEILMAMDERNKQAYMQELFAFGLENWFKKQKCFMPFDDVESV